MRVITFWIAVFFVVLANAATFFVRVGVAREAESPSEASAVEEDKRVIAEGVGADVESARRDAYRNAVRQVVGGLVDAETIVENDRLINDRVVVSSDGFVRKVKPLPGGEVRGADGLWRVRMEIFVKCGDLEHDLLQHGIGKGAKASVEDPRSILARAATRQEAATAAKEAFLAAAKTFPESCLIAEPGQPQVVSVANGFAECDVRIRISAREREYEDFTSRLIRYLESIPLEAQGECQEIMPNDRWYLRRGSPNLSQDQIRETRQGIVRAVFPGAGLADTFDRTGRSDRVELGLLAPGVLAADWGRQSNEFHNRRGAFPSIVCVVPRASPPFKARWFLVDAQKADWWGDVDNGRFIKCDVSIGREASVRARESTFLARFGLISSSDFNGGDKKLDFVPGFEMNGYLGPVCEFTMRLKVPESAFDTGMTVECTLSKNVRPAGVSR
jgi:hypothetical protein